MSRPTLPTISALLVLLTVPALAGAALPPLGAPVLLSDITPGPQGSRINTLLPTPNGVIFRVETDPGRQPAELWMTNGTPEGTVRLAPDRTRLVIGGYVRPTERYVYFDGTNLDTGKDGIWRTDGTAEGTIEIAPGSSLGRRARALGDDGTLVFLTENPPPPGGPVATDTELWVSDGTPEGTTRLRTFLLPRQGIVGNFVEHDGAVYFLDRAPDQTSLALWTTDGTAEGTGLVHAVDGTSFRFIYRTATHLYLLAQGDSDQALSLWSSDGTSAGTQQIMPLGEVTEAGDPILFLGTLDDGRAVWSFETRSVEPSIWTSDGTAAGTVRILDILPASFPSEVAGPVRGLYYFVADDGTHGGEIWETDGTRRGTEIAFEINPGRAGGVGDFRGLGNLLFLTTFDTSLGLEPHVTDGTRQGLRLLGDLCPGPCSSRPTYFIDGGSFALFVANDPEEIRQLWTTDFTAEGTEQLTDFPGGIAHVQSSGPPPLFPGNQILFTADDGVTGTELWTIPVLGADPFPPLGPWLQSSAVPGFEYKVRITGGAGPIAGSLEPACIPETACISGALPGRSEVFVRIVGPRPNGYLWPTLVKFTTSEVEVWIRQLATGVTRYYLLEGARPGFDELPGLFDRMGFTP